MQFIFPNFFSSADSKILDFWEEIFHVTFQVFQCRWETYQVFIILQTDSKSFRSSDRTKSLDFFVIFLNLIAQSNDIKHESKPNIERKLADHENFRNDPHWGWWVASS